MLQRKLKLSITLHALLLTPLFAFTQSAQELQSETELADGEAQYQLFCAECHEGALLEAPRRAAFDLYTPQRIVDVLEFADAHASDGEDVHGAVARVGREYLVPVLS